MERWRFHSHVDAGFGALLGGGVLPSLAAAVLARLYLSILPHSLSITFGSVAVLLPAIRTGSHYDFE